MLAVRRKLMIPEGLVVADVAAFEAKAAGFAAVGASGVHAIFDFDRTLTVKRTGTQDDVTTWHILQEHLPPAGRAAYQRLFEKYRALELSGEMTRQDAVDWWSAILNLFVEHKIDMAAVEKTFLERASIRPGTAGLFALFAERKIPTVILSAGTRDVIDIWCRKYDVHPSLVISTNLILDQTGIVTGWQKETLVHVRNKSEATHPELMAIRQGRAKVLVVGDSLNDAAMATDGSDVIKVRIIDPRDDEPMSIQEEYRTFESFDALIKTGSLDPLRNFIEQIC